MHTTGLLVGQEAIELSIVIACLYVTIHSCIEAIRNRRDIRNSGINHGAKDWADAAVRMRFYKLTITLVTFGWSIDRIFLLYEPTLHPVRWKIYGVVRTLFALLTAAIVIVNRRAYARVMKEERERNG